MQVMLSANSPDAGFSDSDLSKHRLQSLNSNLCVFNRANLSDFPQVSQLSSGLSKDKPLQPCLSVEDEA